MFNPIVPILEAAAPVEGGATVDFMSEVGNVITTIFGWVGDFATSLLSESGDLHVFLPLFVVGIGVSATLLAVKIARSLIWGA